MSCLLPIISQIAQVIQGQGASLLSRRLDIHSDLRLQITLNKSRLPTGKGTEWTNTFLKWNGKCQKKGASPEPDTRAAPGFWERVFYVRRETPPSQTNSQELGRGRTLGMPRAGVALRDVRNAEDRTCPTFSRGKNPTTWFSCFSLQHRHEGLPWTSTWGDGNYSRDTPNETARSSLCGTAGSLYC